MGSCCNVCRSAVSEDSRGWGVRRAEEALAEAENEGDASGSGGTPHKPHSKEHSSGSNHAHKANPKVCLPATLAC